MKRMDTSDAMALLDATKMFIFDCDGVIWRGDEVIEGVPETLDMLRSMDKQLVFVTNNSTKSRAGYLKKFTDLGLNVNAEEIFSSSFAAAAYLKYVGFKGKVYVIGEVGILEELDLAGIEHIGGPSDAGKQIDLTPGQRMEHDADVSAVIVGFDRNVNYYKIQYATLCIRENEGCQFIATNTDAVTHLTSAQEWAGNGSMVGAIKGSTQKEPTVVGKPAPFMLDYMTDTFGVARDQICMVRDLCHSNRRQRRRILPICCLFLPLRLPKTNRCSDSCPIVFRLPPPPHHPFFLCTLSLSCHFRVRTYRNLQVGDRLDTDILFGKDGGLKTLLVLSGVTPEKTLLSDENKIHPDMYTSKLPDLCEAVKANAM